MLSFTNKYQTWRELTSRYIWDCNYHEPQGGIYFWEEDMIAFSSSKYKNLIFLMSLLHMY